MKKNTLKPRVILAVGAHHDDIDICCSGALAKWIKMGAAAYYLILTDGSKGSEDLSILPKKLTQIREEEQKEAAKVLGLKKVFFLNFADGKLENNLILRKEIVRIIRKVKPDTVLTWDPAFIYDINRGFINHTDHRIAGQATLDAIFPFSRNSKSFPELIKEGLLPHTVKEVLLINFSNHNFYVDTTETMETQINAIKCHKSQFEDSSWIIDIVRKSCRKLGRKAKSKYAVGFLRISINQ